MFVLAQEVLGRIGLILASVDRASVLEVHPVLVLNKALIAQVDLVETTVAAAATATRCLDDGGIDASRKDAGLTHFEALWRFKTADVQGQGVNACFD